MWGFSGGHGHTHIPTMGHLGVNILILNRALKGGVTAGAGPRSELLFTGRKVSE